MSSLKNQSFVPTAPAVKHFFSRVKFPSEWITPHLDNCMSDDAPICYGILMPGPHVAGGVPVIKVRDFAGGSLRADILLRTSHAIDEQYRRSRVRKGDILLSIRGSTGELALVPAELEGANITQDTARLRVNDKVERDYLYHALQGSFVQKQIHLETVGQAVQGINIGSVRLLIVPIPSRAEQTKIAMVLGACNEVIEAGQRLFEVKQLRKRGLMQQLLTGRKRFPEFVRSEQQSMSHFGPFPGDWPIVFVGDIAEEVSTKNRTGQELPVLSCSKHRGLVNSLEYFGKQIYSEDTRTYKVVTRGDFAYATNHIEEGSIGYQDLHDEALISPMYTVFRVHDGIDHSFIFKLLKTELYRSIFEANTNGTINRRGALRWDDFSRIKIHLPSEEEQRRIAAVLEMCDREIELLEERIETFKQQKRGLMQKLLTGEIRVKVPKGA